MNTITVDLIKGRHDLPVDQYIFEDAIENIHDYSAIRKQIYDFIETEVGIQHVSGTAINQCDYTDVEIYEGKSRLVVYVTGLTCVTAELIRACALNGIRLTLMNFDSTSGEYVSQRIF